MFPSIYFLGKVILEEEKMGLSKVRRTINKPLGLLGFRVERVSNQTNLYTYLEWLELRHGVTITSVFDIGALVGTWSTELASKLSSRPQFFLFEPNSHHEAQLRATGHRSFCVLLAGSERWIDFYSINGTGDSIFRENSEHYEQVEPHKVFSRTLDSVCDEFDLPSPTLIKLDTQGSEISVLKGAVNIIQSVSLLYLELPILRYNSGAPTLDQYIEYITSVGFLPVGLFEIHIANGALAQVDILFMSQNLFLRVYGDKSLRAAQALTNQDQYWTEVDPT